ncbi:hypothetical protein TNCT_547101 [Trichonephila clavata]|uniref:Uncharacterized protein n=1 Tax=Trichonephila clavata TaxID=2740835 RepID=A0A8X6HRW7_TRICU|nr:hypothetical protein TNCT_547101 [Trichonephila clavata]
MKISYEDFIFSYEGKRAFRQPPSRPDGRVVGVTYPKCIRKQGRWVKNSALTPSTARSPFAFWVWGERGTEVDSCRKSVFDRAAVPCSVTSGVPPTSCPSGQNGGFVVR